MSVHFNYTHALTPTYLPKHIFPSAITDVEDLFFCNYKRLQRKIERM